MEELIEQIGAIVKQVANTQSIFDDVGRIYRNAYNGFINAGFTKEEAFELCKGVSGLVSKSK